MAFKPQLYSNGTFATTNFVEDANSVYCQASLDDQITNSTSSSVTSRRVVTVTPLNVGDSIEILVTGNTLGTSNFASVNTTPVLTVVETDRVEDTTHSRSIQRFVVDNMPAGNVVVFASWGSATTKVILTVRNIGNTAGSIGHANNWQVSPGTAANGVFTLPSSWSTSPVLLTGVVQDSASNTIPTVAGDWTNDNTLGTASTLLIRVSHKYVTGAGSDTARFKATVNEDHLTIMGVFAERVFSPMRIYSNNTVQVGQMVEVAGWTRPQICSNGTYVTPQFVEG